MASAVKDTNYFTVFGWMTAKNRLGLSGAKLKVYAIIYGFTQDGEQDCEASIDYIAEFGGISRRSAISCIQELNAAGLIIAKDRNGSTGKTNLYRINADILDFSKPDWKLGGSAEIAHPVCRNCTGGSAEIAHPVCRNCTQYYNLYSSIDNKDDIERKKENKETIEAIGSNRSAVDFKAMTDEDLFAWGKGKAVELSDDQGMKDFYAYDEEIKRRQAQTPKWTGKIVRTAGEFKKLESHEEIMSIWGLSSVVKDSLRNFLRFCYVNGRLVTNSKLEGILL
jgi:hypothetical protein